VTLLERDTSLEVLRAAFERAQAGTGRLVLVGGEAGVGKTALVRAFADEVSDGARVLVGGCDPLFTPRPLGPILDVAAETGGALEASAAGQPRAQDVLTALLEELERRPTVLVLEDVHWADEATLDLLRLLSRRLTVPGALVVVTYRDDELDPAHPLRIVLGGLASTGGAERLALQPLSLEGVRSLATPHTVDADELYRRTGGNPFFVSEVLGAGGEELPATVRDAVLARAARLDRDARSLLDAVAVVPGPAELPLLEEVAGRDLERLDECLASGMLRADRTSVGFRHELARLAIEESLAPHRRRSLHAAVLAALRASARPDHARLAHHAEAAGDGEAAHVHAAEAARHASGLGAHREAAAQYERALRFVDDRPDRAVAELLELRSYECYLTDQSSAALDARRDALARYRELGDRLREGDQYRWISRLSWFAGRGDDAEEAARKAVALLEPTGPNRELAMAYSNVAQLRMLADDHDGAVEWGERAIALARQLGDVEILSHALNNVGAADALAGRGTARLEESLAIALEARLEEHVARAYTNLASTAVRSREHAAAARALGGGLAYCAERDLDSWYLYMLGWKARLDLQVGDWDGAAVDAAAVLRDPRTSPPSRITPLVVVGQLRARRGDPDPLGPLDEALALARPTGEAQRLVPVAAARAEAALLGGDADAAATEAAVLPLPEVGDRWLAGELAVWLHRAGARVEHAGPLPEPFALEIAGDPRGAAAAWRALGSPYEASLAAAWDADDRALRRAHQELTELGAVVAARLVARRASERGVRGLARGPRPRTLATPGLLTARETEVLRLVAAGFQNAEIGSQLFVSTRTVEHHVSAILRKLGVRSRGQAGTAARQLGLLQTGNDAPNLGDFTDVTPEPPL
jgi:DNA-binding CsgD family transcriptional regulator/tetratricopeptide (TPR) repeat protein